MTVRRYDDLDSGPRYDPAIHSDWLELPDAAQRMNLTVDQVRELVRRRVLRSLPMGAGIVLVEPAIISGVAMP